MTICATTLTFLEATKALWTGFEQTCLLFIFTLIVAIPLGFIVSFGSMTKFKPLKWLTRSIIWVIRGTPLMLQIIVVFYVPGLVFNYPMHSRFIAVLIAFIINYACYFSEIFRSGIQSIPKGQTEASEVLGMTKTQCFFHVTLPQVFKRTLPPISNEIITLVKDTALANVIAVPEIILVAKNLVKVEAVVWPLFYSGLFYLLFVGILTLIFNFIEKKLNYYKI